MKKVLAGIGVAAIGAAVLVGVSSASAAPTNPTVCTSPGSLSDHAVAVAGDNTRLVSATYRLPTGRTVRLTELSDKMTHSYVSARGTLVSVCVRR